MYGDWEGEIAISQMAYPLPDEGLAPPGMASVAIHLDQESWEEDWAARPANDEFAPALSDDPFVVPATEDPTSLKAKPGSDEDWLTPLSNDAFDLGTVDVTGTRYTASGGGSSSWDPAHDTGNSFYDPWGPSYQDTWAQLTDCINLIGITVPDGATYVVPDGITAEYIHAAINYLVGLAPGQREFAFREMYTDQSHPHFLDFKEFYQGMATQTYYSQAAGGEITASAFEPFGNFLFGFVGTLGGIDPFVLRTAAALLQEGDSSGGDAPEDIPHVELGISQARGC
mgnify:CR=1 FL=1